MSMHADIVDDFTAAVREGKITPADAEELCIQVMGSLEWICDEDEEKEERRQLRKEFRSITPTPD